MSGRGRRSTLHPSVVQQYVHSNLNVRWVVVESCRHLSSSDEPRYQPLWHSVISPHLQNKIQCSREWQISKILRRKDIPRRFVRPLRRGIITLSFGVSAKGLLAKEFVCYEQSISLLKGGPYNIIDRVSLLHVYPFPSIIESYDRNVYFTD